MKTSIRIATVAIALAGGLVAAHAQSAPTANRGVENTGIFNPQQRTMMRQYVTTQKVTPYTGTEMTQFTVGATVPSTVTTYAIPRTTVDVPLEYKYLVRPDNSVVLVDPRTSRVVEIIQ